MGAVGPRVGESGFGLMAGYPWTSPYEDITLKATWRECRGTDEFVFETQS